MSWLTLMLSLTAGAQSLHVAAPARLRAEPSVDAPVLASLTLEEDLVFFGETSDVESKIWLSLSSTPTEVSAPWLRVRTSAGVEGWVFGGLVTPPQLHDTRIDVVGFSGDGKVALLLGEVDSYACGDGWPGDLLILDYRIGQQVASRSYGCPVGSVWTGAHAEVQALLEEHAIERVWTLAESGSPLMVDGQAALFRVDRYWEEYRLTRAVVWLEQPHGHHILTELSWPDPDHRPDTGQVEVEAVLRVPGGEQVAVIRVPVEAILNDELHVVRLQGAPSASE